MEEWESDSIVEKWILEHDNETMPLPSIELNPHLLISKVRKHYMEYLIRLLSVNYENNQKLPNKNIYLPSAIWRCAKIIEMSAAQTAMVVNLYRKNIMNVVQELKKTTNNGMLYKKLSECLLFQPENEKKTQTTFLNVDNTCNCQCVCRSIKKVRKLSTSPKQSDYSKNIDNNDSQTELTTDLIKEESQLPEQSFVNSSKINTDLKTETKESDDLMLQMEKIFKSDLNDDDIFDSTSYDTNNLSKSEDKVALSVMLPSDSKPVVLQESQANGLNDRLTLLGGVSEGSNHTNSQNCTIGSKTKNTVSKWLCEEYFMKLKLYELLDQIRDCDRKKLARIKEKLRNLFGDDSDDEDIVSPLDESPEFVMSCRERIAPWVVGILTPHYVSGRIIGKNLFKALAKHLIKLIYQCSKYPHEYEVKNFVEDFLNNHKIIRCEADFKQFKIENV